MAQGKSIREIRSVFKNNLEKLMSREASVSAFCREVGINRTQFNRYLSGESSPRPEILARICDHFEVDARILLEPLPTDHLASRKLALGALTNDLIRNEFSGVSDEMLPDGLYRYWRMSMSQRGKVFCGLSIVSRKQGVKMWRERPLILSLNKTPVTQHTVNGLLFEAEAGFCGFFVSEASTLLNFSYFQKMGLGRANTFYGLEMLGRPEYKDLERLTRCLLERIAPENGPVMAAARAKGYWAPEDAPDYVLAYLAPDIPIT